VGDGGLGNDDLTLLRPTRSRNVSLYAESSPIFRPMGVKRGCQCPFGVDDSTKNPIYSLDKRR
jgi:hypothetical protein